MEPNTKKSISAFAIISLIVSLIGPLLLGIIALLPGIITVIPALSWIAGLDGDIIVWVFCISPVVALIFSVIALLQIIKYQQRGFFMVMLALVISLIIIGFIVWNLLSGLLVVLPYISE
jgi:hypothetical protein